MVTQGSLESSAALADSSRIGGYILEECIGQGGMARVYRARHEALQREVAVKVLLDTPGDKTDGHERFLREARIAAAIKHPNVVNIFDVGVDNGRPFLVMELLDGSDLDAYMHGGQRLDEKLTMDIIVPIAGALAAVHDAGIVHRDLKPGNIFLARGRNDEIEPRLLDFGISKYAADELRLTSAHGPVLGTPFYMSPEAAMGSEMTPLSDQYALGVVLYECVTGVNPFAGATNFADVIHRVTTGDFKPPASHNPQVSRRMAAIIERAMQRDPERRFADLRAMGRELLLLAGQRTRIAWGLTFNSPNSPGALARAGAVVYRGAAPQKPRRSRRGWAFVPALLALGALGMAWRADEVPRRWVDEVWSALRGPELVAAAAATPPLTLALKPTPANDEAPIGASQAMAEPPLGAELSLASATGGEGALAATSPVALSLPAASSRNEPAQNATALAVAQALRDGTPRPRVRRASDRKKPKAAIESLTLGTNNAPILD
jgi:tRNA A-37 threonylcarbamoyl transferase component Bud32